MLAALLAGCRDEGIRVYQTPKESMARAAAEAPSPARPTPERRLLWQIPEGWRESEPGRMRLAQFDIAGPGGQTAEAIILPLSGSQANAVDLVNVWRDQLGLPHASAEDVQRGAKDIAIGPRTGSWFEMASEKPAEDGRHKTRVLVALLPVEGTMLAFKLGGADELVRAQREEFVEFLRSIQFPGATESSGDLASAGSVELPEGHPPIGESESAEGKPAFVKRVEGAGATGSQTAATGGASSDSRWTAPPGWRELPPTQMLLAKFEAGEAGGGKAEITVSAFPGDTGGLLANVNRWRGQLGLEPVGAGGLDEVTEAIDLPGGPATLVEMDGTDRRTSEPVRLMGVIAPRGGQTWFFKMTGDAGGVARERDSFLQFVRTARLADA